MEQRKFRLYVKTPNIFLEIGNKQLRTPGEFIIFESQLPFIETKLRAEGVRDYFVESIYPKEDSTNFPFQADEKEEEEDIITEENVKVEELGEPSLLDKFLEESEQ